MGDHLGLIASLVRVRLLAQRFTTGKNVIADVNIGELESRRNCGKGETLSAMKTINRIALGTISSLLLSAGMARAAQHLDPLSNSLGNNLDATESPANSCIVPCAYQPE